MIQIRAQVTNSRGNHQVTLQTNQQAHSIVIPPKAEGYGSGVNGGELLFLALATCYCNDIYREAARKQIRVTSVEVTVEGEFGAEGQPAQNIRYHVRVNSPASEAEVMQLLKETDQKAEIQNTLRVGTPVELQNCVVER